MAKKKGITPGQFCTWPPSVPTIQDRQGTEVSRHSKDRPTAERMAQAAAEGRRLTVVDTYVAGDGPGTGQRGRAARIQSPLAAMAANGTITKAQLRAGLRFEADFHRACLDTLRAVPLERRIAGLPDDTAQLAARQKIAQVVGLMGGYGSPAANAAWFVIGCGYSIREWARRERIGKGKSINAHTARGIVIGVLSMLAAAYEEHS